MPDGEVRCLEDNDLNALAADMAPLLRRSLGESVETTIRLAEQLPLVMVDNGQIQNALLKSKQANQLG